MKVFISLWLFLVVICITSVNAQTQHKITYPLGKETQIMGLQESSILHVFKQQDQVRVFLFLIGKAYVEQKSTSIIAGKTAPQTVMALAVLEYDNVMKLTSKKIWFLDIVPITDKTTIVAYDPNSMFGQGKTIGKSQDCLGADWYEKIKSMYPELKQRTSISSNSSRPEVHYDNKVRYAGWGGAVEQIRLTKYQKRDKTQAQSEGGFWNAVFDMNSSEYEMITKQIELKPYRESTKDDYWMKARETECDQNTGNIYMWNVKQIKKLYGNRSRDYFQEFVVYDAEGKELNRTEITFDLPHDARYSELLKMKNIKDPFFHIKGAVHMYKQEHGFGYKKLNPEPDKFSRIVYHWDANGALVNRKSFKAPSEGFYMINAFSGDKSVSMLCGVDSVFYLMYSNMEQFTEPVALAKDDPILEYHKIKYKQFNFAKWTPIFSFPGAEEKTLLWYELEMTTPDYKTNQKITTPEGFAIGVLGPDGNLQKLLSYPSPPKRNNTLEHSCDIISHKNDILTFALHFPMTAGGFKSELYKLNTSTLKQVKVLEIESAIKPGFYTEEQDNREFALYADPKNKELLIGWVQ